MLEDGNIWLRQSLPWAFSEAISSSRRSLSEGVLPEDMAILGLDVVVTIALLAILDLVSSVDRRDAMRVDASFREMHLHGEG